MLWWVLSFLLAWWVLSCCTLFAAVAVTALLRVKRRRSAKSYEVARIMRLASTAQSAPDA